MVVSKIMLTFASDLENNKFNPLNNNTMSNQEVINRFQSGKTAKSSNGNLWVSADRTRLFNYYTCVAQRCEDGSFIVNGTRYSNSTSRIQYMLRNTLRNYTEVTNVRIGTSHLA